MNIGKQFLLPAVAASLLLLSGLSCNKTSGTKNESSNTEHVLQINSLKEFQNIVDSSNGKLLVFDLYADWCAPCKILAPTFNALAATHSENVKFYRVNVDNNRAIASQFSTRAIPYVVFMRDKEMVHSITGLNPRETYERVITACGSASSNESCKDNLKSTL